MKERQIRLFLSSTFRDMNIERDYLNTHVFNRIKDYCRSRHIDFIVIDLRWGITEDQTRNGLVLASCLEEVDNSRPFFVGLLGSRYGWIPSAAELSNSRPVITSNRGWIDEKLAQSSSITEMEIEYAAFKDNALTNAVFYLRSPEVDVPADFCEEKDSLAERKLAELKKKLINQNRFPVHTYSSVEELGESIYDEIMTVISREYPDETNDYINSVHGRHEAALQRHAFTLFDVPNVKDFMQKWKDNGYKSLLITGPSGSGTSNYLAITTKYLRAVNPDKLILYYDFEMADPNKDLVDDYMEFLELHRQIIDNCDWCHISVDNANALKYEQIDRIINWNSNKPDKMHVIFAASRSAFADSLLMQEHPNIKMHGLTIDMQFTFINNFTARYGKKLTRAQQEAIVKGQHSNDPTILYLILNTLINFGSMERLDERIQKLIKDANYSIFFGLSYDYDDIFGKSLSYTFASGLLAIALHADVGISEENLINSMGVKMGDWAIVRPTILQFCHGNTQSLTFNRIAWNHEVKLHYSTPWICATGCRLIDWWMDRIDENMRLAASSILSIYLFIWHLPFPDDETNSRIKHIVTRILLSPKTVCEIPLCLQSNVWSYFASTEFSTSITSIGAPVDSLTTEEQEKYYKKLLRIAETHNRYADMEWCFNQLANINTISTMLRIYRAYALFSVQRATEAIDAVKEIHDNKCNSKEFVQKQLLFVKAGMMLGDCDLAISEMKKILYLDEDEEIDENDCEMIASSLTQLNSEIVQTIDMNGINNIVETIMALGDSERVMYSSVANPIRYFHHLALTHYFFRVGDWQKMHFHADYAYRSSARIYGTGGYQFGRAHILVNFAYIKWKGEYYNNKSARLHSFWAYNYCRPIYVGADEKVKTEIQSDNAFYKRLIQEMERIK